MLLPEKRKPTSAKVGSLEYRNSSAATFDTGEDSETLASLQASRILQRFPMSVPLALATARLVYGGAS